MKIKKIAVMALAGAMAAMALTGCSGTGTAKKDANTEKYSIGLVQLVQHEALDAATQGFQDKLVELLGEENVEFDLQNASGDSATCATIANQFVSSGKDLIFANATPALQAAAAATSDIPILGTSITDYATALDIDNWTGATGRNITGTADLAPLAEQAAMFKELLPDAKNIGLIYCSSEANSKYQVDIVKEELTKLGYTCTEYSFADSNDVAAVVTTAVGAMDALYIPTDNTAAANTEIIANIANPANIPIIASEEGICRGCGIATLSISYYGLGQVTGEMAYDVLVNGADPATTEVKYTDKLTKMYMKDRAEALGITIPEGYEELVTEAE
ncbi:MAG: ABC transporter substrate-binding protein [Oscillospiraceae bacterium]|nr:ABC transporter substrate-binding protein [Oscillospiraceae bacterium]